MCSFLMQPEQPAGSVDDGRRQWEKSSTLPHKLGSTGNATPSSASQNASGGGGNSSNSGSESPRPARKRFGSASEETILKQVNGDALSLATPQELESMRTEIIREMRAEIQKAKQEILDGECFLLINEDAVFIVYLLNMFPCFLS